MLSFGIAPLSVSWRDLASNPSLEPHGARRSHTHSPRHAGVLSDHRTADPSISFLTSHFSRGSPASAVSLLQGDALVEQHYNEIEAAILTNVFNPAGGGRRGLRHGHAR